MKSLSVVFAASFLLAACSSGTASKTKDDRLSNPDSPAALSADVLALEALLLKMNVQPEARRNGETAAAATARWMTASNNAQKGLNLAGNLSSRDSAGPFAQLDFSQVPNWTDAQLAAEFQIVRDAANWQMPSMPGQARRLSWMYPDDGCYMRAGLMGDLIETAGLARPMKVFSYGNLSVKTVNGIGGSVQWGYHVAPIVHTPTGYFVIDPAINPDQPTELQKWLLTQVPNLADVTVALCNPHAFAPDSDCQAGNDDGPSVTVDILQNNFLGLEWQRQLDLSRDPQKLLLGTDGSWKHP